MKLQADYIKQQMQAFSEQAKELGESTTQGGEGGSYAQTVKIRPYLSEKECYNT